MWKKLGVVSVIGSIIFGILGAICDAKDVKDRIVDLKNPLKQLRNERRVKE